MDMRLQEHIRDLLIMKKNQNEVLEFMYRKRVKITDAIVAIRAAYGVSLGEAKRIVVTSNFWSDVHHANKLLHDELEGPSKNKNICWDA